MRSTIAKPAGPVCGAGVRSGRNIKVRLRPAETGHGLRLRRNDIGTELPIDPEYAPDMPNCTAIGTDPDDATMFVEHLLACLHVHAITDLLIEVDGPELPLLDGSAMPWHNLLTQAGRRELDGEIFPLKVDTELTVSGTAKILKAHRGPQLFTYNLQHDHPMIDPQVASFRPNPQHFADALAPARTFATIEEIQELTQAGLVQGGSDENCLIIYADHYSTPPTLPNEFARHKILDMIGDLYLLGRPVVGHIAGYQTGHADNRALLKKLADNQ